ncbi:MAG: DUF5320 domain-containing protein [Kiritimatiellia bacterium]|nr:DUF5320 domain-containing protein [Kiritimatiellia bacterium]
MPRQDGTGPQGQGSRTGREQGSCPSDLQKTPAPNTTPPSTSARGRGQGRGPGAGGGRGSGRGGGRGGQR